MSSHTPPPPSAKRVKVSKEERQFQAEIDRLKREIATRDNKIETFQHETATLKQENATFKQETATLKQETTTLKLDIATRDEKIEKLENEKEETATLKQEIEKLEKEKEDSSLLSVLPDRNLPIPNLSPRGLSNYHSHPNKKDATAAEIEFSVPDLRELNDRLGLDLGNSGSSLRNVIDFDDAGILTYENEYDVQDIVQNALRDAAKICNRIIVKKMLTAGLTNPVNHSSRSGSRSRRTGDYSPAPRSIVLNVRRESSIFSNVVDHVVVFDELSGAPVFIVETKKGWNSSSALKQDDNDDDDDVRPSTSRSSSRNSGTPPTAAVLGQVYDQLSAIYAKGHPNPFGAVTCFDETYITCLDNYECHDVLDNLAKEAYEDSRLDRIVRNLVVQQLATSSPFSPSSASNDEESRTTTATSVPFFHNTQSPLQEMSAAVWNLTSENDANKEGFTCHSNRNFLRSACFPPNHIVAAFVSAILCSLDGYRKPRAIKSFTSQQHIQLEALCMKSTTYDWGVLKTTYQGPCTYSIRKRWKLLQMITGPQTLFLVDHLGTGTTSKVYRALTEDGYDCVVKMYVKRQDDDKKILF